MAESLGSGKKRGGERWKNLVRAITLGTQLVASAPLPAAADTTPTTVSEYEGKKQQTEADWILMAKEDPYGFLKNVDSHGKAMPIGAVLEFVDINPYIALQHVDVLKKSISEVGVITDALKKIDPLSAAQWISQNAKRIQRIKEEGRVRGYVSREIGSFIEGLVNYPSIDVAELIRSFYLKHNAKMIEWGDVMQDTSEFKMAQRLIEQFPSVSDYVRSVGKEDDTLFLALAVGRQMPRKEKRHFPGREAELDKMDEQEQLELTDQLRGWSMRYGVKNPIALAKTAVLVARDLRLRKVSHITKKEVKISLRRITEGQALIAKIDPLSNRDFKVLISGDNTPVYGSSLNVWVHSLYDSETMSAIQKEWGKRNKETGATWFEYRVPFDEQGRVNVLDAETKKREFIEVMKSEGRARTLFIETHGAKKEISLAGDPVAGISLSHITSEEFAEAHIARVSHKSVRKQYERGERDIYFFSQCLSFDFAKNVFALLSQKGVPLPVIVASGERSASTPFFSHNSSMKGRKSFDAGVAESFQESGGLRQAIKNAHIFAGSVGEPIIIFVPDKKERPLQVTEQTGGDLSHQDAHGNLS